MASLWRSGIGRETGNPVVHRSFYCMAGFRPVKGCATSPSRLLGAGPITSEARVPPIIRLLASPAGALMVRMPGNRSRLRSILRQSGHGPSLEDGRIPDEFVDWRVRVETDTDSMPHERDMICAIVKGKSYQPGAVRRPNL